MPFFAAADAMTSLIFLVVVAAFSIISSWLKKRRGQTDDEGETTDDEVPLPQRRQPMRPGSPGQPGQPAKVTSNWEEEIRRLLEGDVGNKPPPMPPPIVVREPARPVPPPPVMRQHPQVARETSESDFTPLPVPSIFSRPGQTEESEAHELHPRTHMATVSRAATLPDSAAAHSRASRLQEAVAAHMGHVDQLTAGPRSAIAGITRHDLNASPEVAAVIAMLKNPRSARQVLIANAVLGAPKGLEG